VSAASARTPRSTTVGGTLLASLMTRRRRRPAVVVAGATAMALGGAIAYFALGPLQRTHPKEPATPGTQVASAVDLKDEPSVATADGGVEPAADAAGSAAQEPSPTSSAGGSETADGMTSASSTASPSPGPGRGGRSSQKRKYEPTTL
jgi:hypothetical protein